MTCLLESSPYSNKNVQECRCGSPNCRGILGPRLKDKEQRAKELEEKRKATGSPRKTNAKKVTGTKRKITEAIENTTARQGKKQKLLAPKSIKAGVKRAVAKASTVRGKAIAKEGAAASTTRGRGKTPAKNVKLPTVKTASRVKAAVQTPRQRASTAKASPASPAKEKTSQLKRPSTETKKQILAAAAQGSSGRGRKSPAKLQKTETKSSRKPAARKATIKSPVKAKMPASTAKSTAKGASKARGLGKGVRKAAQSVVRSVRGARK